MKDNTAQGVLRSFPRTFWLANVMELFERGAYYGLMSVLAVYLTDSIQHGGLGVSEQSVGFLQGMIFALTYIIPIASGALADYYGYRQVLLLAFSLLASGYFLAGYSSVYGTVFASLLVMATGSGLFKPVITATIVRSTNEKNSGLGFGIYYWMINMGAFVAPLIVSYLKGQSWRSVFIASSVYCALMLLLTLFLFREPPRPETVGTPKDSKSFKDIFRDMVIVLGDTRFMLMIFLYSGFWIMYFQSFNSFLWYLRDFVNTAPIDRIFVGIREGIGSPFWRSLIPEKFDAEFVTVINAGTIILLQVLVSRIVQHTKPLPTMVTGFCIGIVGFVCLSFTTNVWIFVTGLVIFSIGEMTTHPKYFSYIGLVAPSDKKAVYLGYGFLYGVVGSLIGPNLGGALYEQMVKPLIGQPDIAWKLRSFWLIFAGIGALAAIGLVLYNRFFAVDTPETNRRTRQIMLGMYTLLIVVGAWFFYSSVLAGDHVVYKTMVQAIIMLLIGSGGIVVSSKNTR